MSRMLEKGWPVMGTTPSLRTNENLVRATSLSVRSARASRRISLLLTHTASSCRPSLCGESCLVFGAQRYDVRYSFNAGPYEEDFFVSGDTHSSTRTLSMRWMHHKLSHVFVCIFSVLHESRKQQQVCCLAQRVEPILDS